MKQEVALEILKQGHHVFLTGQAGSGKTYTLNRFIDYLRQKGESVAVTASTGIAATHMNGMTVHAWSGIGIRDELSESQLRALKKNDNLYQRLRNTKTLIIDEVSMLHARQLDLVDTVLRYIRDNAKPFGGVQVVLSGDFFQLPPVGKAGELNREKFAFMSKVWIELANQKKDGVGALKVCYLSEQRRQTISQEGDLGFILNQIRAQNVDEKSKQALLATKDNALNLSRVRLFTHNADVDEINRQELEKLKGKAYVFEGVSLGDDPKLLETLTKNIRAPKTLALKKGAKVMFVKNNGASDVCNGTMGEVVDFAKNDDGLMRPKVKLNDGRVLLVDDDVWSVDNDEGAPIVSFSQLPLCLAWAITVHKSQGMTLDAAEIDLSKTFVVGQGYVALSRLRSLAGLKLLGLNQKSLLLDEFAQAADRRFLQLSQECAAWFAKKNQKPSPSGDFLRATQQRIDRQKKQKNPPIPKSQNATFCALIAEQASLKDIAKALGRFPDDSVAILLRWAKRNGVATSRLKYLADPASLKKARRAIDDLGATKALTKTNAEKLKTVLLSKAKSDDEKARLRLAFFICKTEHNARYAST